MVCCQNPTFIGNGIENAGNNNGGGINIAILPRSGTGNCESSACVSFLGIGSARRLAEIDVLAHSSRTFSPKRRFGRIQVTANSAAPATASTMQ